MSRFLINIVHLKLALDEFKVASDAIEVRDGDHIERDATNLLRQALIPEAEMSEGVGVGHLLVLAAHYQVYHILTCQHNLGFLRHKDYSAHLLVRFFRFKRDFKSLECLCNLVGGLGVHAPNYVANNGH